MIDCFSRGCGVRRRTVCDAEVDADTTPAIITVAGNADLHRERQRAIKVHGFHGESQHLFLASFPLTFFFFHRGPLLYLRRVAFSPRSDSFYHSEYWIGRASISGQCHVESIGHGRVSPFAIKLSLSLVGETTLFFALCERTIAFSINRCKHIVRLFAKLNCQIRTAVFFWGELLPHWEKYLVR